MGGYCGKLLRIDLSSGKIATEAIDPAVARKFIGGRGLGTYYLNNEVDPAVDPLSPENKLILATGPLTGCFPMVNIKVTLLDGKEHSEDSSEIAFHQAGVLAFNEAVAKARPILLEPIMRVQVNTPEEYFGAVSGDLTRRRGEICESEHRGRFQVLTATVPLGEMFGYATELRSLSQGRATYSMEPDSYAPVPQAVAATILKDF